MLAEIVQVTILMDQFQLFQQYVLLVAVMVVIQEQVCVEILVDQVVVEGDKTNGGMEVQEIHLQQHLLKEILVGLLPILRVTVEVEVELQLLVQQLQRQVEVQEVQEQHQVLVFHR